MKENYKDVFDHLKMVYADDDKMLGELLTIDEADFNDIVDRAESWAYEELLNASDQLFNDYYNEINEIIQEA